MISCVKYSCFSHAVPLIETLCCRLHGMQNYLLLLNINWNMLLEFMVPEFKFSINSWINILKNGLIFSIINLLLILNNYSLISGIYSGTFYTELYEISALLSFKNTLEICFRFTSAWFISYLFENLLFTKEA